MEETKNTDKILKEVLASGKPLPAAKKETVLVVDDQPSIRKIICHFLREDGFEPLEAQDGEAALKILLERRDIAVILMDVMMPGMDGFTLCKKIKQHDERFVIPMVIMVSAKSEREDIMEGVKSGAVDYVVKPFQRATVLQKVKRAIENYRSTGISTGIKGPASPPPEAHEKKDVPEGPADSAPPGERAT